MALHAWETRRKHTPKNPRTGKPPGEPGRPRFETNPENWDQPAPMQAIRRHLDLEYTKARALKADGVFKDGMTLEEARLSYIKYLRGLAEGGGSDDWALNYRQEKALHTKAQRERIELELAEERGEVIRIPTLQPMLDEAAANCRVRLLGIPELVAKEIAAVADQPDMVRALVKKPIVEVLNELSMGVRRAVRRASRGADDEDAEAASGSVGAAVGGHLPPSKQRGQRRAGAVAD